MKDSNKLLNLQNFLLLINHRAFNNAGWLFFDKALRLGVGLLVGTWVARYFGPEQYGIFNFALAFITLFISFSGLGLQGIIVRDIIIRPDVASLTIGTGSILFEYYSLEELNSLLEKLNINVS